ncbi:hypothetical protein CU035_2225 [Enterococcus faecium]|nr:hypothetical protein [Enterococcus faecium]
MPLKQSISFEYIFFMYHQPPSLHACFNQTYSSVSIFSFFYSFHLVL